MGLSENNFNAVFCFAGGLFKQVFVIKILKTKVLIDFCLNVRWKIKNSLLFLPKLLKLKIRLDENFKNADINSF